jgi:DNA repair protein RecO (recombination protein O)
VASIHTEAIVLRAVDFGESDRIVHLLAPATGRVTAIAKGARRSRKRFPGTLDFFNHLEVQLERRRPTAMARLEHARLRRTWSALREQPTRFALGCYLLEMLDRLAPEGGAPDERSRLFRFALGALDLLDAVEPDVCLRTLLELQTLAAVGLRPELRRCVRCGRSVLEERGGGAAAPVGFHVAEGGPCCASCVQPGHTLLAVHPGTLRALEQSLRFALPNLGRIALGGGALREARTLVARFLRFHVGLELRSERFLDERLTLPEPQGTLRPLESARSSS